jgi:hypothetical protein
LTSRDSRADVVSGFRQGSRSVLWRSPKGLLQRGARQARVRHRNGARGVVPFPGLPVASWMGESGGLVRLWAGSGPPGHGFLGWLGGICLAMAVIVMSPRTCYVCWTQCLQLYGSEICNSEALRIPGYWLIYAQATLLCCWLRISISGPCRNEPNATSICPHQEI